VCYRSACRVSLADLRLAEAWGRHPAAPLDLRTAPFGNAVTGPPGRCGAQVRRHLGEAGCHAVAGRSLSLRRLATIAAACALAPHPSLVP
jgi:hypothetical protein